MVSPHRRFYGKSPTKAKTYAVDDTACARNCSSASTCRNRRNPTASENRSSLEQGGVALLTSDP
jgi:hypothetical protein